MLENEHFEQFVRIQQERGHRVVTSGPYRWLRHPGYLAAILGALLFTARTWLEDATLRRELRGYAEYAERTRFRLLPWLC
jgi:protein-S-isoprenylcysteine O-methyltransferase Ste14